MSYSLSESATESINSHTTDELWLPLLELTHDDLDAPIRIVGDTLSLTHNGDLYEAYPFTIELPDDEEGQLPVVRWVAANSSRELLSELRAVNGSIDGKLFIVMRSEPDIIQRGPMELKLQGFGYNDQTLNGTLDVEPFLDGFYGKDSMNGQMAPGLF